MSEYLADLPPAIRAKVLALREADAKKRAADAAAGQATRDAGGTPANSAPTTNPPQPTPVAWQHAAPAAAATPASKPFVPTQAPPAARPMPPTITSHPAAARPIMPGPRAPGDHLHAAPPPNFNPLHALAPNGHAPMSGGTAQTAVQPPRATYQPPAQPQPQPTWHRPAAGVASASAFLSRPSAAAAAPPSTGPSSGPSAAAGGVVTQPWRPAPPAAPFGNRIGAPPPPQPQPQWRPHPPVQPATSAPMPAPSSAARTFPQAPAASTTAAPVSAPSSGGWMSANQPPVSTPASGYAPASAAAAAPAAAAAAAAAPSTGNIWSHVRVAAPPSVSAAPPQSVSSSTTGPSSAAAASPAKNPAQIAFLSRFQQPPPASQVSPSKATAPASASSSSARAPAMTLPLCRGHSLPCLTNISRQAPNEGQRYFYCPLRFSSPAEKCHTWVYERDLTTCGLKMQMRGPNGEIVNEVQFSCDLVSADSFSITLAPPDSKAIEFLRSEGGTPDEKIMSLSSYHRDNPPMFIFPLARHDEVLKALNDQAESRRNWYVVGIPVSARQLLMQDLQQARLAKYAAEANARPETDAARAVVQQLAPSPVFLPEDDAEPEVEDRPTSKKKKKKGALLAPRGSEAARKLQEKMASQRHLTPEEETRFNPEKLPGALRMLLLPFQFEGVEYAVERGGRCLIADEMGLGKSVMALAIASYYHDSWPLLIICPSSLRLNWESEIEKFLPFVTSSNIFIVFNAKDGRACLTRDASNKKVAGRDFGIVIISYDLARQLAKEIAEYGFQFIIADESHALKSQAAQRSKAIVPLLKKAQRAVLLSGTPALNRPNELYTQISAIKPTLFPRFTEFGMRYCNGHKSKIGFQEHMDYTGASHLGELHILLKKYLLIRREKADVLQQLPAKRRQTVTLDVPSSKLSKIKKLRAEHDVMEEEGQLSSGARDPHLTKLFQLTGEAKVESVCQYIDELIEADIKFLLFAHHIAVMDELEKFIRGHRKMISYIRIDGSTPPVKRNDYVTQFQDDPETKVALLSITAAGTGLTLTAASHVVMAELNWTPATLVQAEDRVHRIGQSSSCNIHYLLARGTIDDLIWPLLSRKMAVVGQSIRGTDMAMTIDETKEYTASDQEQRRLTGFYRDTEEDDHAADGPGRVDDDVDDDMLVDALDEIESKHSSLPPAVLRAMEESDAFDEPPSQSSASRPPANGASPTKRRKTGNLLSVAKKPAAAASSAASAASSSGFPSLDDGDDEDVDFDLTCTPNTIRTAPTVGVSASTASPSSVAHNSPSVPAGFVRRKPNMLTAAQSPSVTVMSPQVAATASPASTSPPASATKPIPARRRKRIREAEDEQDGQSGDANALSDSPILVSPEPDCVMVAAEEVKSAPAAKKPTAASRAKVQTKKTPPAKKSASKPAAASATPAASLPFPAVDDDEDDFLD